ncbi:MAG TPA: 50S ribosomal protein L6 [Kiritimatiellia bacterium]|nr:50S ribosomal protein L6 [Kiritimatiellia bacterium]
MSRIGKKIITVPAGVTVSVADGVVTVKGPKGELTQALPSYLKVESGAEGVTVSPVASHPSSNAMHGTIRSLINNMIVGVSTGYSRDLEIQGVGFRASIQGQTLTLNLGYSHPIVYEIPTGVTVAVKDNTAVNVSGSDKQTVGQVCARIRSFYPAEPYKGKGVRYKGEQVRRKAGKAVA